jgi:integration host factor subunit alpha
MALTKAELAEALINKVAFNKRDAKDLVDKVFETLRHSLERGEPIKISGFGNFELRNKSQRPGRNPKTGEDVAISARRVVTFKPGHKLKARLEGCQGGPEVETLNDTLDNEEELD